MAITTMDGLIAALGAGQKFQIFKASQSAEGAGTWHSLRAAAGNPAAATAVPATGNGENPHNTTTGALKQNDPGGTNKLYLAKVELMSSTIGSLIIYDNLWQNSGLVGNVTTDQSFSAAVPSRADDGIGVEIWGEVFTAMGAAGSTFTATYVDAADQARTATYVQPANALSVGQMFPFVPTAAGAYGCKSVSKVALGLSTGTAGNFGLRLLKRIAEIPLPIVNMYTSKDAFGLGFPEIPTDASIFMMVLCSATNTGVIMGNIALAEG